MTYHRNPATGRFNKCQDPKCPLDPHYASKAEGRGGGASQQGETVVKLTLEGYSPHKTWLLLEENEDCYLLQEARKEAGVMVPRGDTFWVPREAARPIRLRNRGKASLQEPGVTPQPVVKAMLQEPLLEDLEEDVQGLLGVLEPWEEALLLEEVGEGCEQCGSEHLCSYREDPYEKEVHGRFLMRNLCTPCYEELRP